MRSLGMLGLDTSHAERFAEHIATRRGERLRAIWDGGDVRDRSYTEQFADRYDARIVDDPSEMIGEVDGVLVLTVDWHLHRPLAVPFLRAGLPVLVDKPLAGSLRDIELLEDAAREGGGGLFGGSALPFHPEISALNGDEMEMLYCVGYGHRFYYGAHVVDTVRRLAGVDWSGVAPANEPGSAVDVSFVDGSSATIRFDGYDEGATFTVIEVGDETRSVLVNGAPDELERMYRPYLDHFLTGGTSCDSGPLGDSASLLLACQYVLESDDTVASTDRTLADYRVDATEFLSRYDPYF